MIATVRAYYNTGLTVGNCLDSLSKLDSLAFTYRDFPSIAIKQDRGRIDIRINTTYDNIKDADYVKINNVGYWVTGIVMLNDNVAQVELQQDFVTTVGTASLDIISGWCTRRHVTDDTLYKNTLDEPFTPTNPLVIEFGSDLEGGGSSSGYSYILVSSVDLSTLQFNADKYTYPQDATQYVIVPKIESMPLSSGSTEYTSHISGSAKTCRLPATNAYVGNSQVIMDALATIRSLGIESCIVAAYTLPAKWADGNASSGKFTDLSDHDNIITSTLTAIPGSYKNNKVYSGQFQRYIAYSLATGESSENRVEDIVDSLGTVYWYTAADPRYSGSPVCMPMYFHGARNYQLASCIKGAQWQNIPITYNGASGMMFLDRAAKNNTDRAEASFLYGTMGNIGGMLGGMTNPADMYKAQQPNGGIGGFYNGANGFGDQGLALNGKINPLGLAGGFLSGVASQGQMAANYSFTKATIFNDLSKAIATVDMQFPRVPSIQDYIGNKFKEMRYRLSNNDMVRFDNFLSAFGYAVDEVLTQSCFTGRTHFNYIKANDVTIKKSGFPQYLLDGFSKVLESGVRIWHTAPAHAKLIDNPISS